MGSEAAAVFVGCGEGGPAAPARLLYFAEKVSIERHAASIHTLGDSMQRPNLRSITLETLFASVAVTLRLNLPARAVRKPEPAPGGDDGDDGEASSSIAL